MEILIDGHILHLLPDGGAFDAHTRTLFVADLHFGKTTVFRGAGLPLPEGPDAVILERLARMISETRAQSLVILGDVFHARAAGIERALAAWCGARRNLRVCIVPGNHDRLIPWAEWLPGAEIYEEGGRIAPWRVAHHPPANADAITLCGHLHPGFAIGRARERKLRLPCFWLRRGALVLPAFGEFTGLQIIEREPGDRVWIASAGKVVEIPPGSR